MNFALRVLGDGLGSPSITCSSWQGSTTKELRTRPVEFTISPAAGSVRAMSNTAIKVWY